MRYYLDIEGLNNYEVDSCAVDSWEVGNDADFRTISVAKKHGIDVNHIARKITTEDLTNFDLILVMDEYHYQKISSIASHSQMNKVKFYTEFDTQNKNSPVKDPYYGDMKDFQDTFNIVNRVSQNIIRLIKENKFI